MLDRRSPPRPRRAPRWYSPFFGLSHADRPGSRLDQHGDRWPRRMTSNERDTQQAIALADAGLAHARKLITFQEWDSPNMTPFLTAGDGVALQRRRAPHRRPSCRSSPPQLPDAVRSVGRLRRAGVRRRQLPRLCLRRPPDGPGYRHERGSSTPTPNADVNKRILVRSVGTTANGATAVPSSRCSGASVGAGAAGKWPLCRFAATST